MLKRLFFRHIVKQYIKELEYKLSVTKHSVRRKKLQQRLQQLKDLLK